MQKGLADSLAGRFLLHRCHHWGYAEMRAAFGETIASFGSEVASSRTDKGITLTWNKKP